MKVQYNDIRHPNTWGGKEPENHSPSYDYCRKMIAEGADPKEPLEVYRGEKCCFLISSLEEGAKWKIRENSEEGPRLVRYKPMDEKAKARLRLKGPRKKEATHATAI